jgi:hypothetical protein
MSKKHNKENLAADLLHGAKAIGEFLGIPERRVFYYVAQGYLPVTRIGELIVASRSVLRKHFTEKTAA